MTPEHSSGSPREHSPDDNPTVPLALPRTPRTVRLHTLRFARRHPRPARPSTVWPCAGEDLHEGTGVLATWLLTAVIKIVTTYTAPGQRVLLLAPPPFITRPSDRSSAGARTRTRRSPYDGLHEAAWTVVRLGRGIQTQTAGTHTDSTDEYATEATVTSESGLGLTPGGPDTDDRAEPTSDRPVAQDATATGHGPDRFDLIITAVEPQTLDHLRPTDWANLLTPNGTLALITHGERSAGRFTDPARPLVRRAHEAGLRYLDRVALLTVPVRDGALTTTRPASSNRSQTPPKRPRTTVRHVPVHDDLLLFTHKAIATGTTGGEETSDD